MSRPSPPLPEITAHPTALICQDVDLRGEIIIGSGSVVHPKASLQALNGPIVIGRDCIVEETAMILNRGKEVMRIGDDNHFMISCRVESPLIGDHNTFQPRSNASSGVIITHHCTLSAGTILLPLDPSSTETLPPNTVIFGEDSNRRIGGGNTEITERNLRAKHIEYLREIIPKYNRMRAV